MKIALIGYGKMGKTLHQIAKDRNDKVVQIIDAENQEDINKLSSDDVDVAIEFSNPESAFSNISQCIKSGIPVISGTTGWLSYFDKVKALVAEHDGTFMYASNFSIGVNIFFELNEYLAKRMSKYNQYRAQLEEIHHTEKLDAPSGTAITLAEGLLDHSSPYKKWVNNSTDEVDQLEIVSKRIGKTPGTHTITYGSKVDEIMIKHTAHSRLGFAEGAYEAATWIRDKKGVFDIKDMLFA